MLPSTKTQNYVGAFKEETFKSQQRQKKKPYTVTKVQVCVHISILQADTHPQLWYRTFHPPPPPLLWAALKEVKISPWRSFFCDPTHLSFSPSGAYFSSRPRLSVPMCVRVNAFAWSRASRGAKEKRPCCPENNGGTYRPWDFWWEAAKWILKPWMGRTERGLWEGMSWRLQDGPGRPNCPLDAALLDDAFWIVQII